MAHKMDDFHFCSAKMRPAYCLVESNTCCFNCEHNSRCQGLAKEHAAAGHTPKLKPCTSDVVGVDDVCEFAC